MRPCVYCGSRIGAAAVYADAARRLGCSAKAATRA